MKITFIKHSCFMVELDTKVLLFDYYAGRIPEFDKHKKLYVFASHKHPDHFDISVFDLENKYNDIVYIFSSDIKISESYLEKRGIDSTVKNRFVTAKKDFQFEVNDLNITTFKSTDEGVAFLIETENQTIYHAGDLNWWHWEGEPGSWNPDMEKAYKNEIDKMAGKKIDVAFIPVDGRLGNAFFWGMDYFMKTTDTKKVFPMHLWEDYDLVYKLMKLEETKDYREKVVEINIENQTFEI